MVVFLDSWFAYECTEYTVYMVGKSCTVGLNSKETIAMISRRADVYSY